MKKIALVFGTRPEAIKMVPLILALKKQSREFRVKVIVTAQHRQMLDQVLNLFGVRVDVDLKIMSKNQSLTEINTRVLTGLAPVLKKESPDLVLVHGDTTTTMAAALASFYQKIPVGHVEAGLRSFDHLNPYPEEINRTVADSISVLHFAPTAVAAGNLRAESIPKKGTFITGNTGIDALYIGLDRLKKKKYAPVSPRIRALSQNPFVLMTVHRRENFGKPLMDICRAVANSARRHPNLNFIYPVHLNPQIWNPVHATLGRLKNVHLLKPLAYPEFVYLMDRSVFILTDSGGVQEEAPSLGKPVLVLRKVTERPEAVRAGTVRVIGTTVKNVSQWIELLIKQGPTYKKMAMAVNPYGDGQAASRSVEAIRFFFGLRRNPPAPMPTPRSPRR